MYLSKSIQRYVHSLNEHLSIQRYVHSRNEHLSIQRYTMDYKMSVSDIHTLLPELGDDVYGTVIKDNPNGSEWLCSLNKEWGKVPLAAPYVGVASKWMTEWNSTLQPTQHTVNHQGVDTIVHGLYIGSSRKSHYYPGDVFQSKKVPFSHEIIKKYLGMDDFGTMLLVSMAAKECLEKYDINHRIANATTYAVCGRFGIWTTHTGERLDLLPNVDVLVVKMVLSDVHKTLNCLHSYSDFHHGNLVLSSVLLDGDHTRLTNFFRSSILLPGKIKVFNESQIASLSCESSGHVGCVNVSIGTSHKKPGAKWRSERVWWKLGVDFDVGRDLVLAHSGLAYYAAIDWYVFMVSMMMHNKWYEIVITDISLRSVWNCMWLPGEVILIINDCVQYHSTQTSLVDVYRVLKRYHMCADCMECVAKTL